MGVNPLADSLKVMRLPLRIRKTIFGFSKRAPSQKINGVFQVSIHGIFGPNAPLSSIFRPAGLIPDPLVL